jgi:choline-phosphate cytidylyltransferase
MRYQQKGIASNQQERGNERVSIEEIAKRLPEEYRQKLIQEFKKKTANNRKIRVYSDGCWDMFHYGHARQFEQIKRIHPNIELVVGVCTGSDIVAHKGVFVMDDTERTESIRHCKWTDDIIFPAPWSPTIAFLDSINVDFIAHDAIPYTVPGMDDCYKEMKEKGRFLPTLRTEGVSTSDLLVRILKEKDDYTERNLKKGYSRKQLNLSIFEYLMLKMKGATKKVKNSIKRIRKTRPQ